MAGQPPADDPVALSRPGSLTFRLKMDSPGFWRWSLSLSPADRAPTEAPALATGLLMERDADGVLRAVQQAVSHVLASDDALPP